ncbi:hypothetical protein DFJ66_4718 [Saccharothrix variisporea]|uniref:Uncharacterized protein n=1 Tax=Saccharothrix variisporea TaxID=543527 RepID=A0A495XCQ3_9PSEU|nr:hypothetical protein DFJ66_4718 [Saccharothrix variisporea]
MELDERLRELFSDERLDLPARDDAVPRIVGGARRRRRTRTVATGALVVAAVVGGVVAAQGLSTRVASEPGAGPVTTIRPQALEPPAHGPLRLGMTAAEVVGKGFSLVDAGPCLVHQGDGIGYNVLVSRRDGVVAIRTPTHTKTPSGVGYGSSVEELRRPYPDLVVTGDRATVAMGSDWGYVFDFVEGKVAFVRIEKIGYDCGSGG